MTSMFEIVTRHRAVVCVGTGGVGKTTVAAALGLAGALAGRRTMVLTIDPARQLARALGLSSLERGGEAVPDEALRSAGLSVRGSLHAGMLDQKGAWDAFIVRHAPSAEVRDTLLSNPVYQQVSTSFAGSFEYMAIEELVRLDESGEYDLIVIDTPPAGAAVDFLRAPDRIEHLVDPAVMSVLSKPVRAWGGAWGAVSAVVHRLQGTFGTRALREISAFFVALDAIFGDVAARSERARAMLRSDQTAFVLVAGPTERVLADGDQLAATMRELGVPLRATVINRVHPLFRQDFTVEDVEPVIASLASRGVDEPALTWLRRLWVTALRTAEAERNRLAPFAAAMPADSAWVEVPELDHDAHSLDDLVTLARLLGALG